MYFDLENAIRIYYECTEIGNKEISEIFEGLSTATISRRKQAVRNAMRERNIHTWQRHNVDTVTAYEIWGMDIKDLESRRKKLISLGMYADSSKTSD